MTTRTRRASPAAKRKPSAEPPRIVLAILSNRFNPSQTPRFIEIRCLPDGSVLSERPLRSRPRQAKYDEVWENDDGKQSLDSCTRIRRHYKHALLKPR